jgi:hypothetical protein
MFPILSKSAVISALVAGMLSARRAVGAIICLHGGGCNPLVAGAARGSDSGSYVNWGGLMLPIVLHMTAMSPTSSRRTARSGDRGLRRATCWVTVLPACTRRPAITLASAAPAPVVFHRDRSIAPGSGNLQQGHGPQPPSTTAREDWLTDGVAHFASPPKSTDLNRLDQSAGHVFDNPHASAQCGHSCTRIGTTGNRRTFGECGQPGAKFHGRSVLC